MEEFISRSSRGSCGDSAIGFVKLNRKGNICTVQAQICPEHRISKQDYFVEVSIDVEEEIVKNIQCHSCTAALGKVICLFFITFITSSFNPTFYLRWM